MAISVALQGRSRRAVVHIGAQDDDSVSTGISDKALWRPEPHRLGVEESGEKDLWMVELEPCRGIDEIGERDRMGLGKAVVRKCYQLIDDRFSDFLGDPSLGHAMREPTMESLHSNRRAL